MKNIIKVILLILIVFGVIYYIKENDSNILISNPTKVSNNSTLSMMFETGYETGVYEIQNSSTWPTTGYRFNSELSSCSNGSEISWDSTNSKVVVNSRLSDMCFVYFDALPAPEYVYWNNNFSNTQYTSTQVPTGTGLNGTYATREELATAYSSWSNAPIYIKTTKVNGTVTGHAACLWYNDREFCISPNYWTGTIGVNNATEGANTKAKIKADMENALGITIADSSCNSSESYAYCYTGDFRCSALSFGGVDCGSGVTSGSCDVYGSGDARCD